MTLVFHQFAIRFLTPVKRHTDLPGPREHIRILYRRLVEHVVWTRRRVTLYDVQGFAVKISGAVKPGSIIEVDYVYYQRISLPVPA